MTTPTNDTVAVACRAHAALRRAALPDPLDHRGHGRLRRPRHQTWVNRSVFLKLTIPDSVPAYLDRIIYLDTDLVVLRSLSEPCEQEIGNHAVLAARDNTIPYLSSPQGMSDAPRRALALHPDIPYFSAGVLVLNLAHWRRENTAAGIMDYLREYRGLIRMDEQEGLNAVIGGRWGELDPVGTSRSAPPAPSMRGRRQATRRPCGEGSRRFGATRTSCTSPAYRNPGRPGR